ncbi:MAG TPA: amidohydrolase family protein [Candidatus Binatia bacterium]|jgi:predicted TIM-barrel fold metal-dependent hydrolase|nr:amidohydrolase family protein [Candidatus Binatia bacterium]
MTDYKIISGDTHIVEPPDLYTSRISAKCRDRAPRIKRQKMPDGTAFDAWFMGDTQVATLGAVTQAGRRFEDPTKIDFVGVWEDVREGAYEPHAMIHELARDGIWGGIIQPSQGLFWYHIDDSELLSALCQAYNDWIADFCRPYPHRLRGIGMLNVDDVSEACAELERCAKLGLAGMFIPVTPLPGQPYRHRMYERLWATAQDVSMPLLMHLATQRAGVPGCEISISFKTFTPAGLRPTQDYWVRYAMTDMIFAGVCERYPGLRVGSVEHEISWAPHWLKQMDYTYRERPVYSGYKSKEGLLPSDYWHRNLFAVFQEDEVGVQLRHRIGIDNMLWGNDFPHSESTWPKSREFLEQMFAEVPVEDRRKLTCDNAVRIFHFSLAQ